jgi:hypothetical protein
LPRFPTDGRGSDISYAESSRDAGIESMRCIIQIFGTADVVAFERRPRLVPGRLHGYTKDAG